MTIPTTKPKILENDQFGERYSHPAYGCVSVSRVNGSAKLFGSPFDDCMGFISLSISRAVKNRSFHIDSHFPKEELIEVNMTFEQWANLLCSFNQGSGVACTIDHVQGEYQDRISREDESLQKTFNREFKDICEESTTDLDAAINEVKAMLEKPSITKSERKNLLDKLVRVQMGIKSNLPFLAERFTETVEKVKTTAKHEMFAFQSSLNIVNAPALPAIEK